MYSPTRKYAILFFVTLAVLGIAFLTSCEGEQSYVSLTPLSDKIIVMWDSVEIEFVDESSIYKMSECNQGKLKIYYLLKLKQMVIILVLKDEK